MQSLTASRRDQRGLSLVEMMVGITIGLFVVAGASMLMVSQLGENRRLLLETQVQQDLRATADIITRDIRRAGYYEGSLNGIWQPNQGPVQSSWSGVTLSSTGASYRYERGSDDRFEISLADEMLRRRINDNTQPLTDHNTLRIRKWSPDDTVAAFSVAPPAAGGPAPVTIACPNLCPDGTQDCWPTLSVRDLQIRIRGVAASDPDAVKREVVSRVRLRNDDVVFNLVDPVTGLAKVCP